MELPELSLHTGINRIKDAQAVKADTIITACSFCEWNLDRAAKSLDSDINPNVNVINLRAVLPPFVKGGGGDLLQLLKNPPQSPFSKGGRKGKSLKFLPLTLV